MPRRYRFLANALTWLFALAAALAFFGWVDQRVIRHRPHITWLEDAFTLANIPMVYSLVSVVALSLITVGLIRHKRMALLSVIALQLLGGVWALIDLAFIHLAELPPATDPRDEPKPLLYTSLMIALLMVPALIKLRPAFPARVPKGSWKAAAGVGAGGVVLTVAITSLLLRLIGDAHGPAWKQLLSALMHALGLRVPAGWHVPVGHLIPQLASAVMGLALVVTVIIFLRTARSSDSWQPANELAVRQLLAESGDDDSLGYYATRRDKLLHFSADRKAAVAYRVVGGVCLASGDPVGAREHWADAITSWDSHARRYGWTPAVLACGEAGARAYRSLLGFDHPTRRRGDPDRRAIPTQLDCTHRGASDGPAGTSRGAARPDQLRRGTDR